MLQHWKDLNIVGEIFIANTQKNPFHGIYFFITLDKSNMAIKMHNIGKSM